MNILKNILFYISVPKCACCGERLLKNELALCKVCKEKYNNLVQFNCSICSKIYSECTCTNRYLDAHFVHKHIKVFRYFQEDKTDETTPPTNALIYSLKQDHRADVLEFLTNEIVRAIRASVSNPESYVFTSVPRRKAAIVEYGFDHAELLARQVAKKLGAKYLKTGYSLAKRAQKKAANSSERITNVKFKLRNPKLDLSSKNVILIDDIVTTGASMGYMATLLKGAGAKAITAASIAIAYRDRSTRFHTGDRFSPK